MAKILAGRARRWLLLTLGAALLVACSAFAPALRTRADGGPVSCAIQPTATVDIDTQPTLSLEIARTEAERERGLMFRESLPWDSGMLFVYTAPSQGGYWMRDTLIPLSIAWLDQDGTIVDIQDMQPQTDTVHIPAAPYWYALEVNQGWFAANGVGVGQRVRLCLDDTSQG